MKVTELYYLIENLRYILLSEHMYFPAISPFLSDRVTYIQAKLKFELILQRPDLKNGFDEELILWSKAVIIYCKVACKNMTSIQKLVKDVDMECKFHQMAIKIITSVSS